jgi:hypothetical protein
MDSASSTNTSMLYSPLPTPPGDTSPSSMEETVTSPPAAV